MSDLALIPASSCDKEELSCLNEALSAENAELKAKLTKQPVVTDMDIFKARAGLHVAGSGMLYTLLAAMPDPGTSNFFDHPRILFFVVCTNIFAWTIGTIIRKFG